MGVCHFDQKSSTQKSENLVPNIHTEKFGNLPEIDNQKSGNQKRYAFLLSEKITTQIRKSLISTPHLNFIYFVKRLYLGWGQIDEHCWSNNVG